jgi:hypothetical protein
MEQSTFDAALNQAIFSYVLMAVIATLTAVMIRGIVYVLEASQKKKHASAAEATPVLVSVTPEHDEGASIAAAIGAAVYSVLGAHRLVYIGEARRGAGWTTDIRSQHRTSHMPRI